MWNPESITDIFIVGALILSTLKITILIRQPFLFRSYCVSCAKLCIYFISNELKNKLATIVTTRYANDVYRPLIFSNIVSAYEVFSVVAVSSADAKMTY